MSDLIGIGKYSSERDCILHFMCTSEWSDDSFGDAGEYGVYYWTIMNTPNDVQQSNTEFISLLEQNGYGIEWSTELAESLVGYFIVTETAAGHVDVTKFDDPVRCTEEWARLAYTYYAWLGIADEEN